MGTSFRRVFTHFTCAPQVDGKANFLALDHRPENLSEISQDATAAAIVMMGNDKVWPELVNLMNLTPEAGMSSARFVFEERRDKRPKVVLLPPCPEVSLVNGEMAELASMARAHGSALIAPVLANDADCEIMDDFGVVALCSGHQTIFLTRPTTAAERPRTLRPLLSWFRRLA